MDLHFPRALILKSSLFLLLGGMILPGGETRAEPGEITFAPAVFQSSTRQTALLELYTSEGCSSCPPAEKWLSELKKDPGLWLNIVPVAFHVNYWDQLGWPDKFASRQFTERQYDLVKSWKKDAVYTPEFVLNGMEWRVGQGPDWRVPSKKGAGSLKVSLQQGNRVTAVFTPAEDKSRTLLIWTALLVSDVSVAVKAGENAGRKLDHDFVALSLDSHAMTSKGGEYQADWQLTTKQADSPSTRLAIAAWVTQADDLAPLQATGGWLHSAK